MSNFSKNNYYNGKLLSAESFKIEQKYNTAKLAQVARAIFGEGVIYGFNVTESRPDTVEVAAGAAVDGKGRLIQLDNKTILSVKAINNSKTPRILSVAYKEVHESAGIITERCDFICNEGKGIKVKLAEITFEDGKIKNIRDIRKPVNSQFLKSLAGKSTDDIASIFYNYLPIFVKHINAAIDHKIKNIPIKSKKDLEELEERVSKSVYDRLEKKFEDISQRVKALEAELKITPKPPKYPKKTKRRCLCQSNKGRRRGRLD
jgi:hypothetical protein